MTETLSLFNVDDFTPIHSPLNYTGGKYKLLPQIVPYFPRRMKSFVDLFCGGCNIGLNLTANNIVANTIIFNDSNSTLIELYRTFIVLGADTVLEMIGSVIAEYGLSDSSRNGYAY